MIALAKSMTSGKEWKLILLFTLPLMAGNLLQQLYNTVDGIIVGNYVGPDALASVGTCTPMTMLFVALAMGLSNGCAIVVSQYFGAKQLDEMRRAVSTAIIMLVVLGVVLSGVGVVTARPLLRYVLNVDSRYLEDAVSYFSIYAVGLAFQFTYNIFAAVLRSLGDSSATLYFLLVSSVTNIVLDLLFVRPWGVAGAAIATVISQGVSAVVCVVYMFKKHAILRYQKGEFGFHKDKFTLSLRMGVPTMLQQCVISSGHMAIQRLINTFEVTNLGLMAGFTAAMRIENFVLIPVFGFNMGMATFTGQNIGAGQVDRVKRGLWSTELMGCLCCVALGVASFLLAEPLVGLFGLEAGEGLEYGMAYIHFIAPLFVIFCFYLIIGGVIQGAGDVLWSTIATVSSLVFRIIMAYFLGFCTPVAYRAAWVSVPLGWVWALIILVVRYRSGAWQRKAVVHREERLEGGESL